MTAPLLDLAGLSVARRGRATLSGVSLSVGPGECVGLIGPNGAGKTTLLHAALGLIRHQGRSSLSALPPSQRALHAAFLPQTRTVAWPMPVRDLVALGLLPHRSRSATLPGDTARLVDDVLAALDLGEFADRIATELSGGELARVLLARVLVQRTPLILADEPGAGLDLAQQIALMGRLRQLASAGRGILVSLHDLGLAARFCTRLVLMQEGQIVADDIPHRVLTPERMASVFGLAATYVDTPEGPFLVPLALSDRAA
ncbi:ABC transporter ATP-binding protein [Pararhodobacter zhoushanensis]|uniref:ABC transporter ATP-binding protein n=1 Tax=Pararhodobacter zhoushanensis TaxID=2479545 RepID=UPI0015F2D8E3|nr:ABC transporter ATP-binding protein [Pararhodobacter zhoushanensis]